MFHNHARWGAADQMGAQYMAPNQTPFLMSIFGSWRDTIKRRRKLGATNDAGIRRFRCPENHQLVLRADPARRLL